MRVDARRISLTPARASIASAIAYGVNVVTVSLPGRIDGEMQKRAREAKKATASGGRDEGDESRAEVKKGDKVYAIPLDSEYRSLFTPAGWAFAIWGAIYAGEAAFAAHGRALVGVWVASLMWAVAFGTGDDA